jgi:hypothetical protein
MGILVEERGMAWNFPTGTRTSSTSCSRSIWRDRAERRGVQRARPAIRAEITPPLLPDFRTATKRASGSTSPTASYDHEHVRGVLRDMDVGDAGFNYATRDSRSRWD